METGGSCAVAGDQRVIDNAKAHAATVLRGIVANHTIVQRRKITSSTGARSEILHDQTIA